LLFLGDNKEGVTVGISVKDVKKQLDKFIEKSQKPKLLVIGYRTYTALMREDNFADSVTKDKKDPLIRYYKGIEIKVVTEKHYFEVQ
jgi:hypothetical protein